MGTSDARGNISISKKMLRECSARVIMLRAEWHFDGALRVDDKELNLLGYDEFYVELAPWVFN